LLRAKVKEEFKNRPPTKKAKEDYDSASDESDNSDEEVPTTKKNTAPKPKKVKAPKPKKLARNSSGAK
jgi:hypothetical protein